MTDLMKSRIKDFQPSGKLISSDTAFTTIVTVNWEASVSNPTSHEPRRFRVSFPTSQGASEWVTSASPNPNEQGSPTQNRARRASVLRCTMAQIMEWLPTFEVMTVKPESNFMDTEDEPTDDFQLAADEVDTDFDPAGEELEEEVEEFAEGEELEEEEAF